jgi:hypothetical protein
MPSALDRLTQRGSEHRRPVAHRVQRRLHVGEKPYEQADEAEADQRHERIAKQGAQHTAEISVADHGRRRVIDHDRERIAGIEHRDADPYRAWTRHDHGQRDRGHAERGVGTPGQSVDHGGTQLRDRERHDGPGARVQPRSHGLALPQRSGAHAHEQQSDQQPARRMRTESLRDRKHERTKSQP